MTDWKAIAIHWHQESCACSDPVGHMEGEAEMEIVEAGDRALETARKCADKCYDIAVDGYESIDQSADEIIEIMAHEIQSAMNAQEREPNKEAEKRERELRKMLRKAARNLYEASELLRDCGSGTAGFVYDSSQEILAELARIPDDAERLLAERGGTQ